MYIDENLTTDMQGWLNTEPAKRDLMKGAEMVLKLTRNRYLYQNISRNPQKFASKIEYELKKHLAIRLDRKTIQDVVKMDKELVPAVAETLATFQPEISSDDDTPQEATIAKGKRVDHDSLPEEIRRLWYLLRNRPYREIVECLYDRNLRTQTLYSIFSMKDLADIRLVCKYQKDEYWEVFMKYHLFYTIFQDRN